MPQRCWSRSPCCRRAPRSPVLVALAAGIGLATPPVGACLRTQLPALLRDPGAVRAAYALEASVVELTYIFGPPLALCIGALWSTGAALAVAGLVLLAATAAFAAQPASRRWRPAPAERRPRGGSLRTPAMRTLVIVLIAVGVLLGADEVAVTAAAKTLASTTAAAPLFAVWGAGSFIGGLLVTRLGGGARSAAGLALLLGALTAGHLALIPADGASLALGAVLLARRRRDRADRGHHLRDGRPRRPGRHHDRGLRLARHRDGSRRRRRSGRRRDPRRPCRAHRSIRARRRRRRARGAHPPCSGLTASRPQVTCPKAPRPVPTNTRGDSMNTHPSPDHAHDQLASRRWRLDLSASTAEFRVPHFWGLVTVKGHFERFDGHLEVDEHQQRQMTLTIDATSLNTGNRRRDKHLRSADFFDTQNHPEMRFRSTSVTDAGDHQLEVQGELDVAGERVPLALTPAIRQSDQQLDIEVTTTVDQRRLGMTWSPLAMTRTPVTLTVHARLRPDA